MKNKIAYIAIIISLGALATILLRPIPIAGIEQSKKESAFERVMRTQTIRCAYISRAHHFMVDAATKQKSGIDYEVVEAIGKLLHLNIDWVEETGYGIFPEQLNSGKEDALCITVWSSAARAARILSTVPIMYSPLYVSAREEDTRFDNNIYNVNNEQIVIAVIDGSTMKSVADTSFPKAKQFAVPGMSDGSEVMLNVATNKADVGFFEDIAINDFNKQSRDKKLRRVQGLAPVRNYEEVFSVAMGEFELREILNTAISELQNDGTIDRILNKYGTKYGAILRASDPYAPKTNN